MGSCPIDYGWIDDVGGGSDGEFQWTLDSIADIPPPSGVEIDGACEDAGSLDPAGCKKRLRNESCARPKSKACREKMRRDRLNDRFLELSAVLEPGQAPKSDKVNILADAARVLAQLRNEVDELKEANEKLQDTIKDLKVEKNELRDEKLKLKEDKERLEQQLKIMRLPSAGFFPHPASFFTASVAAFTSQNHASMKNGTPFPSYPGLPTWQWLPPGQWLSPAARDVGQDPKHVSPTA